MMQAARTDTDLLICCPIKVGTQVQRKKGRSPRHGETAERVVVGTVRRRFVGWGTQKVKCEVEWEGALNGARRFGSNAAWNQTTCILAASLVEVKS
jgi:hypothetical protein